MVTVIFTLIFLCANVWSTWFSNAYTYPKWIIFDIVSILAIAYLVFKKERVKFSFTAAIFLAAIMIIRQINVMVNPSASASLASTICLQFLVIAIAAMNMVPKMHAKLNYVSTFLIFTVIAQCFLNVSPLGNVNIIAEYLILTLPLLIGSIHIFKQRIVYRYFNLFTLAGSTVVIILAQSRSAYIGLALIGLYLLKIPKKFKIGLAVGFFAIVMSASYLNTDKRGSTGHRFDVYKATIDMMIDHPFGIGGGQFEFGYLPYQMTTAEAPREVEIYQTPHNEYLKWGVEQGFVFMLLTIIATFMIYSKYFKFEPANNSEKVFSLFLLALMPQLLFQFPFENPASLLIIAFFGGQMLAQSVIYEEKTDWFFTFVGAVITASLLTKTFSVNYSRMLEGRFNRDKTSMQVSCKLDRSNWRSCFQASLINATSDEPNKALPWLTEGFKNHYFDFHQLRALAFYYAQVGDKDRACQVTQVYKMILKQSVMFNDFIYKDCADYKSPLIFVNPKQFENAYKEWLTK